jgi:excisionase family DNA binding protein
VTTLDRRPPVAVTPSGLLSVPEAAQRLKVTDRFIRRLIFERRIPYVKLGRHVRIQESDLEAFVHAGRIPTSR